MEELTDTLKEMAIGIGALRWALRLQKLQKRLWVPPSADLTYVLPEAKSALCFALGFDESLIDPYFKKEDHKSLDTNKVRTTTFANGIALEIAGFLQQLGYKAAPQAANFVYRSDINIETLDMKPPISHRYLAVRSGIGQFGYSGNIITNEYGSAIVLASVVTDAELVPTDPLPEEEDYCDECKLCLAVYSSGFVDPSEKVMVTLGGKEFSYGKRRSQQRCGLFSGRDCRSIRNSGKNNIGDGQTEHTFPDRSMKPFSRVKQKQYGTDSSLYTPRSMVAG